MKAKIDQVLELLRDYATTHEYPETPILTAYVDIDTTKRANQRMQPAWLIDLKNEAKRLEQELDSEQFKRRNVQQRWTAAQEMILEHLLERKPGGRSVVLFSDLEDFVAVDLPISLPTRLYYGLPQIKHLLFTLDQYESYLVILFSGAEARLVEVFLTRTTEDLTIETEHERKRRLSRKSMEAGQDRRSPEFKRRFVNEMASELTSYFMEDPDFERLILGGNLKLAHAVKKALHPAIKEVVVAIEPIEFNTPENDIAALVKRIAADVEAAHDLGMVEELVRLYNSRGAVALEQQGVETALSHGQVETLVLPYPLDGEELDSLIVEVVVNGAEVEFVHGEAADKLQEYGGIGAKLYYSMNWT